MALQLNPDESYLALDVGKARIGLARAGAIARLPEPLQVIQNDEHVFETIASAMKEHNAPALIVGIPRNSKGEETDQSSTIRQFAEKLANNLGVEIIFADESLSSKRADKYLFENKRASFDQDSVAACFILQEFFNTMARQA